MEPTDVTAPDAATHRSAWSWVLRRWWVVAAATLVPAVLGGIFGSGIPAEYESETVVVASAYTIPAENFEGVAETLASSRAVLDPVIDELGLDETPESLLQTGKVEATPVTGSVGVSIIGRAEDQETAAAISRTTAQSFADVATARDLGTFQVFETASAEGGTLSPTQVYALAGGFVGALLSIGALLLLSFVREPLFTEEEARRVFPCKSSFAVRVSASRVRRGRGGWAIHPPGATTAIRRSLGRAVMASGRLQDNGEVPFVWCVLVERHGGGDRAARAVAADLVLGELLPGLRPQPRLVGFRVRGSELEPLGGEHEWQDRNPAAVVAVAMEGAPAGDLRALDEFSRAVDVVEAQRLLVFVRSGEGRTKSSDLVVDPFELRALPAGGPVEQAAGETPVREAVGVDPAEATPPAAEPAPPEPVKTSTPPPGPETVPAAPAAEREQARPAPVQVPSNGPPPDPAVVSSEADAGDAAPETPQEGDGEADELLRRLADADAEVRLAALRSLLEEPRADAGDAVRARLRDSEPKVRALAVTVLAAIEEARRGR